MVDPKLLTENGWKPLAQKWQIKDNGLQRALAGYEKLDEKEYDGRLKAIASVNQLAVALKRNAYVADIPVVAKYLAEMADAADSENGLIAKAKALAAKTAAASQKKTDAEEKKQDVQEEKYEARLLAAFQKLKSAKDLSFEFLICDAKPHCAVMIAKRITPQHKEELTRLTDGSKRFLHPGTCLFEDGKFAFNMDQPASGLARKLQDSIKFFTNKKFPIIVGADLADDEEE